MLVDHLILWEVIQHTVTQCSAVQCHRRMLCSGLRSAPHHLTPSQQPARTQGLMWSSQNRPTAYGLSIVCLWAYVTAVLYMPRDRARFNQVIHHRPVGCPFGCCQVDEGYQSIRDPPCKYKQVAPNISTDMSKDPWRHVLASFGSDHDRLPMDFHTMLTSGAGGANMVQDYDSSGADIIS